MTCASRPPDRHPRENGNDAVLPPAVRRLPRPVDEGSDGRGGRARTARSQIGGQWVRNFGSDSFLGLDQDPRVQAAVARGVREWGTHNGTSRAFSSVGPNVEAEAKIAAWLGTEATLIYPSVTLANVGRAARARRPGTTCSWPTSTRTTRSRKGCGSPRPRGVRTAKFAHNDPGDLETAARVACGPYRHAVVAIDGVYSMSGQLPPLARLPARGSRQTTASCTWTTPTAPACSAPRAAAPCSTRSAATTTRWSSARCRRRSRAWAGSSAGSQARSTC